MALGFLLVIFIALAVLEIIGLVLLFVVKKPTPYKATFIGLAVLTLLVSFMGATSLPSNYIMQQIIGWGWGVLALIAVALNFFSNKHAKAAKYLLTVSSLAGLLDLFFI